MKTPSTNQDLILAIRSFFNDPTNRQVKHLDTLSHYVNKASTLSDTLPAEAIVLHLAAFIDDFEGMREEEVFQKVGALKLEPLIIKSANEFTSFLYCANVKGANIQKHIEACTAKGKNCSSLKALAKKEQNLTR